MAAKEKKPQPTALQLDHRARNVAAWLGRNIRDLAVVTPSSLLEHQRYDIVKNYINLFRLEMNRTPKLTTCSPPSVFHSLIVSIGLDLPPNSMLGQLYMIPYGKQCTPIIGYRGYEKMALEARDAHDQAIVKRIDVGLVYKGQEQECYWDARDKILYTPRSPWGADMGRENVIGGYCAVYGFEREAASPEPLLTWELMPLHKILERARRSQSYKPALEEKNPEEPWLWFATARGDPAVWQTDFEAMCEKTVVRAALSRGRTKLGTRMNFGLEVERQVEQGKPIGAVVTDSVGEPVDPSEEFVEDADYEEKPAAPQPGPAMGYDEPLPKQPPPAQEDSEDYQQDVDPTVDLPPGLFGEGQ